MQVSVSLTLSPSLPCAPSPLPPPPQAGFVRQVSLRHAHPSRHKVRPLAERSLDVPPLHDSVASCRRSQSAVHGTLRWKDTALSPVLNVGQIHGPSTLLNQAHARHHALGHAALSHGRGRGWGQCRRVQRRCAVRSGLAATLHDLGASPSNPYGCSEVALSAILDLLPRRTMPPFVGREPCRTAGSHTF